MRKKLPTKGKAKPAPTPSKAVVPTPKEIAEWMVAQIEAKDELYQVRAVEEIKKRFGREFVYPGNFGELSIDTRVLYQFRKLTGDKVVWVTLHGGAFSEECHWRKRVRGDRPGRIQYLGG